MNAASRSGQFLVRVFLCVVAALFAATANAESALFIDEAPLKLELRVDLKALCRSADRVDCEDVSAQLIHRLADKRTDKISVVVRTRGDFRLDDSNCKYPPLFLRFEDDAQGTVFEGREVLPLTTQCRTLGGRYRDWVLREYLAYRIYQMLTDKSVRTRLVRLTWAEPSGDEPAGPYHAFFSEHFRSMAARNNAQLLDLDEIDLDDTDPMELATLDLFQFMIGNTDWSTVRLHNAVAIEAPGADSSTKITIVPFDFDFSGLVNAAYAQPPSHLPIRTTRHRLYRGFCHPDINWDDLFERFQAIKPEVYELLDSLSGMSRAGRRGARRFLKWFYQILDDPRERQKKIIEKCRPPPG